MDFLRDGGSTRPEPGVEDIEVLDENWSIVAVFRRCRPNWITGMHAPLYDGLAALEIEAAARLNQVPADDYPDLLWGIDVMVRATREARNETTR